MRYQLEADGEFTGDEQVLYEWDSTVDCAVGLAIDPLSTPDHIIIYATVSHDVHNDEWGGRIERFVVQGNDVQASLVFVGLPVGFHQLNSATFGPDGKLYVCAGIRSSDKDLSEGSCTTSGMPGQYSNEWSEKLLSAAFLSANVRGVEGPIDVQSSGGKTYNPYAPNAPISLFGTAIRNPYDSVWHSNGNYYATTNQNDVNGQTGTCNDQLPNLVNERPDEFLAIIRKGQTYGFPNAARGECVLMGGNPTGGNDPWEVPNYPVGTAPVETFDPSLLYNVAPYGGGSADGMIEYKTPGYLQHKIVQAYYGWGGAGKIWAYTLGDDGKVVRQEKLKDEAGNDVTITDCLDVTEHPSRGHLYVARYGDQADNGAAGGIYFLRRLEALPAGPQLEVSQHQLFVDIPEESQQEYFVKVWNAGTGTLDYTLTSNVDWITITPPGGSSQAGPHQTIHRISLDTSGIVIGNYPATVSVEGGGQQQTLQILVNVNSDTPTGNREPQVDAGEGQEFYAEEMPFKFTLTGTVNDDGPPELLEYEWSVQAGLDSEAVTIVEPHNLVTEVTVASYGIFTFQLAANDGEKTGTALVRIIVDDEKNEHPSVVQVNANYGTAYMGEEVVLNGVAVDDGLPSPPGQLFYTWARVETGVGLANFSDPYSPNTNVSFTEPSSYLLQLTVTDGSQTSSMKIVVTVLEGERPQSSTISDTRQETSSTTQTGTDPGDTHDPSDSDDPNGPSDPSGSSRVSLSCVKGFVLLLWAVVLL